VIYQALLSTHALGAINRTATVCLRFALTLVMIKHLGFAELGIFALCSAAALILPEVSGFGISQPAAREAIHNPAAVVKRLARNWIISFILCGALSAILFLSGQTLYAVFFLSVASMQLLNQDISAILINRARLIEFNAILFMRNGIWPLAAIVGFEFFGGVFDSLLYVFVAWSAAEVASAILGWRWLSQEIKRTSGAHSPLALPWVSIPFYLSDLAETFSQYLDRFVLALFLTNADVGKYFLAWSIGNALYTLSYYGVYIPERSHLLRLGHDANWPKIWQKIWRLQIPSVILLIFYLFGLAGVSVLSRQLGIDAVVGLETYIVAAGIMLTAKYCGGILAFTLYAVRYDTVFVASNIGMLLSSAALNFTLVPMLGLNGAFVSGIVTALLIYVYRYRALARMTSHAAS
jgi:O-antigen/teichoic acid export membrane protein